MVGIARRSLFLGLTALALGAAPARGQTRPAARPVTRPAGQVILAPFQLVGPIKDILAETAAKRPVTVRAAGAGDAMDLLDNDPNVDLIVTDDPAQRRSLLEAGRLDLAGESAFARDRIVLLVRSERATPIRLRPGVDLVVPLEGNLIGTPAGANDGIARQTRAFLDRLRLDAPSVALLQSFPSMADLALALDDGQIPAAFVPASLLTHRPHLELSGTAPADVEETIRYSLDIVAGRDRPETRALRDALTGPLAASLLTRHGLQKP